MTGKKWREEILDGVKKVEFPGCVCGSIIVYGEKAEPIIANQKGQVLCAAAELGNGRVVVFSHGMFVKSCKKNLKEGQNERFLQNVRNWVSKKAGFNGEIVTFKEFCQRCSTFALSGAIVIWTGDISTNDKELSILLKWISDGGALICGLCPWGFLSLHQISLESIPLYHIFEKVGVMYAGKETFKCNNNEIDVSEMQIDFIKPAQILQAVQDDYSLCYCLCDLLENLPNKLYEMYRKEIISVLQKLEEVCHCTPCKSKPVDSDLGKYVAILKCRVMINEGLQGRPVKCEGIEHFPGNFQNPPPLTCCNFTRICNGQKYHPTGCYLPAGNTIKISWSQSTKPWKLYIGPHKGKLLKSKKKLRRWPIISMKLTLDPNSSSAEICSPFGGLLYLKSPKCSDKIECWVSDVVEAPTFTYESATKWKDYECSKPGLWCDIIGEKISFTLPSSSVRNITDLTNVMRWWDSVVDAHIELRGKDTSNGRGQWIVADEQLFLDGAYMISGYPILTHLDVVSPKQKKDDCFVFDLVNLEKKGAWGIFHEIGHNFQDPLWTWKGTNEVTVNIFTLHAMDIICNISTWTHPWLRKQFEKARDYLRSGADIQQWYDNPGIALLVYAQLARDFGWETYKTVFKNYDSLSSDKRPTSIQEKEDMWIVMFSIAVERNLCPLFDFWGWKISDEACTKTKQFLSYLPKDETTTDFAYERGCHIAEKYCVDFKNM